MKYAFFVAEDINLGAGYIMSYLKSQGHEVELFFDPLQYRRGYAKNSFLSKLLSVKKYNIKRLIKFDPQFILFSCVTATYQWALETAKEIREITDAKIIFGGSHPTLVPEEVKRHKFIDEVCVGDGIAYFGGTFKPDDFYPDRKAFFKELPPEHRRTQIFMTSFGCPFNCSFCGNEQMRAVGQFKSLRRSVEGCIKELIEMKKMGAKEILFVDDVFTSDKKFLMPFLKEYKDKIDLPFTCFGHAKFLDEDSVAMLKQAGCTMVWFGIQNGLEQLRKEVLNRHETTKEIIEAAQLVKKYKMQLMIDHIFGIPFETNISSDISYNVYRECNPDIVNCYNMLYFPKSKIIEHAMRAGLLNQHNIKQINEGTYFNYQLGQKRQVIVDTYYKAFISLPLKSVIFELLPDILIKIIVNLKARRFFIMRVIIENEIYFTYKALLKKLRARWI